VALYGSSIEYGLHCLLYLVDASGEAKASSVDLAEFQGLSPSYVAKLFTQLKNAGLVAATEGSRGGYQLARAASDISVFD
jgi:Rrf2 family protein